MKRTTKIISLILCAILLIIACDAKLAQPERHSPGQDQFIGFHLVYEKTPLPMEELTGEEAPPEKDYSLWTEYGSDSMMIDGLGRVSIPRMILIGQWDTEHDRYIFPGLEGLNCFMAVTPLPGGGTRYAGYSHMADVQITTGQHNSISGKLYMGPPLDDSSWNSEDFDYCWTAYRVYQMEDGTVYLDGGGNSYSGVGGFGFSEKTEWTTSVDGESVTESFEVSVDVESIPRQACVTVKQFDGDERLLRTDTLTAQQAQALETGTWRLAGEADTAYIMTVETDVEGNTNRAICQPDPWTGSDSIRCDTWFLDDAGMGYCVSIEIS